MKLAIQLVEENGGTQSRDGVNVEKVREYSEILEQLPPIIVFYDGAKYWLADGFHRLAAAVNVEAKEVDADVRQGTQRDAILFSFAANAAHGIPRSNADKRRAVERMLGDEEWKTWSDRRIAEACRVSPSFVGTVRASLSTVDSGQDAPSPVVGRDGRTYNATNLGRSTVHRGQSTEPPAAPLPVSPHVAHDQLAADAETALASARALADAAWVHPRARLLLTTAVEDTARWCARRQREATS